jgi:integrase
MTVYRDERDGTWRYRKRLRLQDGTELRISGTPPINTRVAAETAERAHIVRAQAAPTVASLQHTRKEVPSFGKFAADFMASYARANNRPSEQTSKTSILKTHLLPAFDRVPLDRIGVQDVERLKAALLERVSRKRVNNVLNVLSKILKYAHELEVIEKVPRIKTLKVTPTKFDFFTYEELDRLVDAAKEEPEWQAAIMVAGDAGLRMGEILALQWDDLDLKTGTMTVMRTDWRGQVGAPKGGRARKIPLTPRLVAALKAIRHLRSKLVFCWEDGKRWTFVTMRAGIKRQEKRAGLRVTGWHVLRHTFCSHLAMKGAPPRAIQELAGHQSITVTNRYMHMAPGELRSAIALLNRSATSGQQVANRTEK